MAYPQRGGKPAARRYPFGDSDFSLGIRGTKKANGREPVGSFSNNGSSVYFNGAFLAEGDKQFSIKLTFKQMGRFIRILELIANHPGNDPIALTVNVQFPKDGQWHHSGNTLTIGRNANGIIYFTPGNKQIEACHFKLTIEDDTRITNHEKLDIDSAMNSKLEALRYVDFLKARLDSWIQQAVADGQAEAAANAGAGGGNGNSNFQPQQPANNQYGNPPPAGGNDFDDGIPF